MQHQFKQHRKTHSRLWCTTVICLRTICIDLCQDGHEERCCLARSYAKTSVLHVTHESNGPQLTCAILVKLEPVWMKYANVMNTRQLLFNWPDCLNQMRVQHELSVLWLYISKLTNFNVYQVKIGTANKHIHIPRWNTYKAVLCTTACLPMILSVLTGLCTSHQVSLGQDDRQRVLLYWCRLFILTQHDVVLNNVSKINVRKLPRQTNMSYCHQSPSVTHVMV